MCMIRNTESVYHTDQKIHFSYALQLTQVLAIADRLQDAMCHIQHIVNETGCSRTDIM